MATGAIIARILTQYSNKGSKQAQKDIKLLSKTFSDFSRRSAKAFGIATAASAAFAVKIGKDAVQAAIADQKSQALLANTLRNTTGATESAITGVETYITSLQKQFNVV
jgi:histone H3/H4